MIDVDFIIEDSDVTAALELLLKATGNLQPAMQDIAVVLEDITEQAFEDQANPETGEPWPELAASTILQRSKEGKWPGKMLQKSAGGLAPSITSDYGNDFAAVGSNKVYAAIHQFGGDTGLNHGVSIPPRPYLGLSEEGKEEILDIIADHIQTALG